jgi:hypothetical protein
MKGAIVNPCAPTPSANVQCPYRWPANETVCFVPSIVAVPFKRFPKYSTAKEGTTWWSIDALETERATEIRRGPRGRVGRQDCRGRGIVPELPDRTQLPLAAQRNSRPTIPSTTFDEKLYSLGFRRRAVPSTPKLNGRIQRNQLNWSVPQVANLRGTGPELNGSIAETTRPLTVHARWREPQASERKGRRI